MEPMALGSPPSPTNNYLPSFLMGDNSPAVNQPPTATSPSRIKTPVFRSGPGDCRNLRQKLFKDAVESPYNSFGNSSMEKGPPKQGLFDTLDANKNKQSPVLSSTMHPMVDHVSFTPNDSVSRIVNDSLNVSQSILNQSAHNQSLHNQSVQEHQQMMHMNDMYHRSSLGRPRQSSLWVTVFGFAPSSASVALSYFANCGQIVDKKFPTQGNYVHLKFSSHQEVSKALAMNGKMVMSNIMVGVIPFYLEENKENANTPHEIMSPIRARSLRHSYISPQSSSTVLPSQNVPQKSTGIVTKAMEYVFGW